MYYCIMDTLEKDYTLIDFASKSWMKHDNAGWDTSLLTLVSYPYSLLKFEYDDELGSYDTLQEYLTIKRKDRFIILFEISDLSQLPTIPELYPELFI